MGIEMEMGMGMEMVILLFSDELEFEWLNQYWVQGVGHHKARPYWHKPIEAMETVWNLLEKRTLKLANAALRKGPTS